MMNTPDISDHKTAITYYKERDATTQQALEEIDQWMSHNVSMGVHAIECWLRGCFNAGYRVALGQDTGLKPGKKDNGVESDGGGLGMDGASAVLGEVVVTRED